MATGTAAQRRSAARRSRSRRRPLGGGQVRRAQGRIHWERLGRIVLVVAIITVLASYVQPLTSYFKQRSAANRDRAALTLLQEENSRLRSGIKEKSDSLFLEAEARRLGMVRAGERPYVINH